jgi:hypothetical protein
MKKWILVFFLLRTFSGNAQITGSDTTCPDYIYFYDAIIAGADSFYWTPPLGWYVLSGQGTSHVELLCNADTTGGICVNGYDSNGVFITQFCKYVTWGGLAGGWDVNGWGGGPCICDPWSIVVIPNGTGGNCGGCGNGVQSSTFAFGVYYAPWPSALMGIANSSMFGLSAASQTVYVYPIDLIFGIGNEFLVLGGACGGSGSNVGYLPPCINPNFTMSFNYVPYPVCVGDTFMVYHAYGYPTIHWSSSSSVLLLDTLVLDSIIGILIDTSSTPGVMAHGTDINGCPGMGGIFISYALCPVLPVAGITATPEEICVPGCIDFSSASQDATTFSWSFPGGIPDTSTSINPSNICYNVAGNYDVTLIASNFYGSDTLTFSNYINVFPMPPGQSITQSGDTLFALAGSASYQWYFNGSTINGATDYFYIAIAGGDYNVIATDSNGCEVEAVINNVLAHAQLAVGPEVSAQLAIFPNPVSETLTISRYLPADIAEEISIYNMLGEKILLDVDLESMTFNCQSLKPGIYFLELVLKDKSYRGKFVKAKK